MKYFTITELCQSSTAQQHGIDNRCPPACEIALKELVQNVLDPIRDAWGKPIRVNSGYRCPELNGKVHGASYSQHLRGEAADITVGNKEENKKLFELIKSLGIPLDQLIDENKYSWLHISYRKGNNRNQILHLGF